MSIESFSQFQRDIGRDVITVGGVTWFNPSPYLFSPIPYDIEIRPDEYDLNILFRGRCLAIRCAAPEPWGRKSYRLAISDPNYDLTSLDPKSRNQTRRGLESCVVRQISFSELGDKGVPLQVDTMIRQGRKVSRTVETYWRHYFACAAATDCAMAWAAYCGEEMAAYLITFILRDTAHVVIVRSSTRHLKQYPNNALIYTFVRYLLQKHLATEVSFGFESMQAAMNSLDHFKEGLGFKRVTSNRYVQLSPALRTILRGPAVPLSQTILRLFSRNEHARKLSSLIDWYAHQRHA